MTSPIDYQPNTPQFPGDTFAETQEQLQENFQVLYNYFMQNHIPLDNISDLGNHTIIQLIEQGNSQQTSVSEIAIYAKNVEGQTDQVFFRQQGNGQEMQLTNYQIYSLTPPTGQTQFFTFLPGGIIVYFGSFPGIIGKTVVVNLTPLIAKNIITVTCCSLYTSTIPFIFPKPCITFEKNQDQIISVVNFNSSGNNFVQASWYLIMANT